MLFPKSKMGFTKTLSGNTSEEGWLVLEIGNMELEGVTKLYIDLREVEEVRKKSGRASDTLSDMKRLLGGE